MKTTQSRESRKLFFGLAMLILLYIFIETASFVAFRIKYKTSLPLRNPETGQLHQDIGIVPTLSDSAKNKEPAGKNSKDSNAKRGRSLRNGEVLHPFLGFVRDPDAAGRVSEYGFMLQDGDTSLPQRTKDKLIVGIFGGSVAAGFSGRGRAPFVEALRSFPEFSDKEIVVVSYAMGGYKQPQQLMALNYLMLLGGELDVAINLDGYNEIALYHGPNADQGVFPMYPTAWNWRVRNLEDEHLRGLAGGILYLRSWQNGLRSALMNGAWRHSPTVNFVWKNVDDQLTRSINKNQKTINAYEPDAQTYAATGPRVEFAEDAILDHLVDVWSRSSLQMAQLSEANGIRYFHFLQPNQYVEDSKPMGSEELSIAIKETVRSEVAKRGYGQLISEGQKLKAQGVPFFDLTTIFENIEEPTYADSCCHLNQRGKTIEAEAIARTLSEQWGKPQ
jgi:hypothetical protein